ncbi:MAG TPA: hypothetical protein VEA69_25215, partial [Tepidisphaeraceae bacterium]|nr:hypothetical protein [Tepidisphaeraceae bacterium]
YDDAAALARTVRALAKATLDEVNALRQWEVDLKAAFAGASTLAQLKTAVAALPDLPPRTSAQVRAALRSAVDGNV